MVINKVVVCPVCGKRTYLRIQDGGYLHEYPIRVNCINCRALLRGSYIMKQASKLQGLTMLNAEIEECIIETKGLSETGLLNRKVTVENADYVAEISGELPCRAVDVYRKEIPVSPYLQAVDILESVDERKERLTYFTKNMEEWNRKKSIAFQLLNEGSFSYIARALDNKLGSYTYMCDHYIKAFYCLQEVVLSETKNLFTEPDQDAYILQLIGELSKVDKETLHEFCEALGGVEDLLRSYRRSIEVFSDFMGVYPNLLPAETFMHFKDKARENICIATCSFSDIKTFYQDAYESLLSLAQIPVCLDNMVNRGNYQTFDVAYEDVNKGKGIKTLAHYRKLDNGTRINKLDTSEYYQAIINIPANRLLRNGIGHNSIEYDGITQRITIYDLKHPQKTGIQMQLIDMAVDCIGLARSAVIFSEIILFLLKEEIRRGNITTLIHPRFYKNAEPNMKCPCGSNRKYKKCCRNAFEALS